MKKKLVSLVLIISLLATFPCVSIAVSAFPEGWEPTYSEQLCEQLGLILSDPDDPLGSAIDFENIQLGEAMKAYEIIDNDISKLDFDLYPVFSSGRIVLFANKVQDSNGSYSIQISHALADEISEFTGEEIALLYDAKNCYAVINGQVCASYGFTDVITYRSNLSLTTGDSAGAFDIEYTELSARYNLNYSPVAPAAITTTILSVPVVIQQTNYTCWAATTASIGNYLTGISMTDEEVAMDYLGNTSTGANLNETLTALLVEFGVSYTQYSDYTAPSQNLIYRNVANDYPVYGRFTTPGASTGHLVVIRGIASNGTLYLMDPLCGYSYAYYGSSSGLYTFTYSSSGTQYTLVGYGAKYP